MKNCLLLVLAFAGSFAFAEGEVIIRSMNSCLKSAYSEAQETQCARTGFKRADDLLNLHFQQIISNLDRRGVYLLRERQHEWLNNTRNYGCQANPDTGRTFSNAPIGVDELKCFAKVTVERVNELVSDFE